MEEVEEEEEEGGRRANGSEAGEGVTAKGEMEEEEERGGEGEEIED